MIHMPLRAAQLSSAIRRAALMVIPIGYWCDGVMYAARTAPPRRMCGDTSRPSGSTDTGTSRAPAAANASRAPGYPGSSTQTRSPGSSRTCAASCNASCDPVVTNTCQVLVTTGSQLALQLAAQVLLDPGDRVWVEEPGYPGARLAFAAAGARLVPVSVDPDGLDVSPHIRRGGAVRAAYITPSHQYPMGMTMSAARRIALLNWAARSGMWIIEDDYDSEYRFESRPVASLQGQDEDGRVLYIGTFSKVLFPSLRLGYMVVPRDLVSAFAAMRDATDIFSSVLYQAAMTDFIREGHFARHLRRMRMLYMERREALAGAIRAQMGDVLEVVGTEAGMHFVALLPPGTDDVAIAMEAARRGVSVIPLSSCYLRPPSRGGLILGFGGAPGAHLASAVGTLRQCVAAG